MDTFLTGEHPQFAICFILNYLSRYIDSLMIWKPYISSLLYIFRKHYQVTSKGCPHREMLSLALTKFWHATSHESDNKPHMQQYIDNLICKIHNTIQDDQSFKVFSSPDSGSMILEVLHKGVVLV